jgi:hypothetical protein
VPPEDRPAEPVTYVSVSSADEVDEILRLQAENLPAALTAEALASQGFVTVRHDPAVLRRMNRAAPGVVAKAGGRVVGYALVMPRDFAADVPILRPMFDVLDTLTWRGLALCDHARWFVVGQVCVALPYRGIGVVDGLYRRMAECYAERFDLAITEVAARNGRSLRAHARVGFETLHVYPDPTTGEEWHLIALDLAAYRTGGRP